MPPATQHRLDPVELRVLGCLLEKQRTTPDQYPLSLNALRLACNQATNRESVLELSEDEIRRALHSLANAGWARLASGPGSRVAKYRQLFDESLDLLPSEAALLALLFLRGPQTISELKARTERLHHFAANDDVLGTLQRLDERELAHLLPRRPGQREERWTHLLAEAPTGGPEHAQEQERRATVPAEPTSVERRVARLEDRVAEVERALAERGLLD